MVRPWAVKKMTKKGLALGRKRKKTHTWAKDEENSQLDER